MNNILIKNTKSFINLFIIIILIPIILKYIYIKFTMFETKITIKNKYKKYNSPDNDFDDLLMVVDTDNNEYNITNLFFKLDFNKQNDWNQFNINNTYYVKGYGLKIQNMGLYRNIYEIVNILD